MIISQRWVFVALHKLSPPSVRKPLLTGDALRALGEVFVLPKHYFCVEEVCVTIERLLVALAFSSISLQAGRGLS